MIYKRKNFKARAFAGALRCMEKRFSVIPLQDQSFHIITLSRPTIKVNNKRQSYFSCFIDRRSRTLRPNNFQLLVFRAAGPREL